MVDAATQDSTYSPESVTNCNGSVYRRRVLSRLAHAKYVLLEDGMRRGPCWLIGLTDGRCTHLLLRPETWHKLLTQLKRAWPSCEAATAYEWSQKRGIHLHAVVRGTPGLSTEWVVSHVERPDSSVRAHCKPVFDGDGLAGYLVKAIGRSVAVDGWPRYFRPVSMTRGWSPLQPSKVAPHRNLR
jgi:hypothetical protein